MSAPQKRKKPRSRPLGVNTARYLRREVIRHFLRNQALDKLFFAGKFSPVDFQKMLETPVGGRQPCMQRTAENPADLGIDGFPVFHGLSRLGECLDSFLPRLWLGEGLGDPLG
jgi:hypothetical protein